MAFDATRYETIPQTNVPGTLALIRAVITASKAPSSLPAAKKALKRLRAAGEALRGAHQTVAPPKLESTSKAADASMDRIWTAVEQRLAAWLELGGDDGAEAERVHSILFPNGLSFLGFKYAEQWAEGEAILARVKAEKLTPSLEKLAGAPFVAELHARHVAYGEALGITKAKAPEADGASLVEPLRAARSALATYARVLVAAVDNGEFDEAEGATSLAPLALLRDSLRASKKKGAPPVAEPPASPEPLPPVE